MIRASELPRPVKKVARAILFPYRAGWAIANRMQWLGEAPVGDEPHLDPEALKAWRAAIAKATVYLEYGSGGSTVEAASKVARLIAVESDKGFLAAVAAKVAARRESRAAFRPLHADIGWTEQWGRPLVPLVLKGRRTKGSTYTSMPWRVVAEDGVTPDFIFIDGRFRVACVLESFLRLPPGSETLFMLDDFAQRSTDYAAFLPFARDVKPAGRALVFRRKARFDRKECERLLDIHVSDPE